MLVLGLVKVVVSIDPPVFMGKTQSLLGISGDTPAKV